MQYHTITCWKATAKFEAIAVLFQTAGLILQSGPFGDRVPVFIVWVGAFIFRVGAVIFPVDGVPVRVDGGPDWEAGVIARKLAILTR